MPDSIGDQKATNRDLDDATSEPGFEFDYACNVIFCRGQTIRLSPHEADVFRVLLNNRARPTPSSTLIQRVYGAHEPDAAATSVRVAIHSLRKKLQTTGMSIQTRPGVGYEVDTSGIPELNRLLADKILMALNHARAAGQSNIVQILQNALKLSESTHGMV